MLQYIVSYTQTVLSERLRNLVVELTLTGRNAAYIADMFDFYHTAR